MNPLQNNNNLSSSFKTKEKKNIITSLFGIGKKKSFQEERSAKELATRNIKSLIEVKSVVEVSLLIYYLRFYIIRISQDKFNFF